VEEGKRRGVEGEDAKEVDMGWGDVGRLYLNGGDPFEPEMAPPFFKRFSLSPTGDPRKRCGRGRMCKEPRSAAASRCMY
jgi:hypothetical protein